MREAGVGEHELGEVLRAPEEDELRLGHGHAGLGRVAAVVDHGEDVEAERFDPCDGAPQELVDAPVASQGDHAVRIVAVPRARLCAARAVARILRPRSRCRSVDRHDARRARVAT